MNVLLITVDSLRYDVVTDDDRPVSLPELESFRDDCLRCSRAFAGAPYTADSFRSIMSGTYPWRFGTTAEGFETDRPHIVDAFSRAEYRTAGFYTNPYLGPAFDYNRGWDHYTEGESTGESRLRNLRQFVVENVPPDSRLFSLLRWGHRTVGERLGIDVEGKPYPTADEVVTSFLDWLDRTDERPIFGWLHFMDIHSPFYPHESTVSEGVSESRALRTFYSVNKRPTEATDEELDVLRTLYCGEIEHFDEIFGTLLDGINERLDPADTTILFTSDHGEAFDEHGFCFHPKELYDELLHIPFLLRSPTVGRDELDTPVSTVDILPTLLDQAGLDRPEPCDGTPITELAERDKPRHVFAHAFEPGRMKAMVTDGRWKLLRSMYGEREELYDREADPDESENKVEQEQTITAQLGTKLDDHLAQMETERDEEETTDHEVSADVEQRLKELGYR